MTRRVLNLVVAISSISFNANASGPVGSLPACDSGALGSIEVVTDAADSYDCSVGGGSALALCLCDGDVWGPALGGVDLSRYQDPVLTGQASVSQGLIVTGQMSATNSGAVSLNADSGASAKLKVGPGNVEIRSGLSIVRFQGQGNSTDGVWLQNVPCIWVGGMRYCHPSQAHPYPCTAGEPGIYFDLDDGDFCRCARPAGGTQWYWLPITSRLRQQTRCVDNQGGEGL